MTFSSTVMPAEEADILKGAGDAGAEDRVRRFADDVDAPLRSIARGWGHETGDDVEKRRLAGAVRSDHAEDLALAQ